MRKPKLETLVRRVRELANMYPDAKYYPGGFDDGPAMCSYSKGRVDNGPLREGCIIGQAAAGYYRIPPEDDTEGVGYLMEKVGYPLDTPEVEWLREVQEAQDRKVTWAEAVKYADTQVVLV